MAGSVGLVQFNQGDDVCSAEFREGLNAVAQQAADGTAWAFGFGLIGSYSPGTGFTLAFDEALLPTMRKEHFLAKLTAAADGDGGYAWKEMEVTGKNEVGEKENGRTSGTGTPAPDLAFEYNGSKGLGVDRIVTMWEVEDTAGNKTYWIDGGGSDFTEAAITGFTGGYHSWEKVGGGQTGTLNLREINGRRITPGHKVLIWPDPANPGKFLFDRGEGVAEGSQDLTPGATAASWNRLTDTEARGGTMGFVANVRFGGGKFEKLMCNISWDSSGRLVSASMGGEPDWKTVFETEECPPEEEEEGGEE